MIIRQVSCHPHCSLIPTVKQNSTIKFSFSGYMLHFFLKKTILQSLPNQKAWINAETRDTPRIKMTAFHGSIQPRHSVTESWHHERQSRDIRSDLTSTPTPEICGRWSRTSQAEDAKSPLSSLLHLQRTGQRHSPQRMLEERCWEWICIPVCALKTTSQPELMSDRQPPSSLYLNSRISSKWLPPYGSHQSWWRAPHWTQRLLVKKLLAPHCLLTPSASEETQSCVQPSQGLHGTVFISNCGNKLYLKISSLALEIQNLQPFIYPNVLISLTK